MTRRTWCRGRVRDGQPEPQEWGPGKPVELIGRVQLAYEHLRDTMQRYREDSRPRARIAIAAAKRRLSMLNRALALLALEVAAQPEAA